MAALHADVNDIRRRYQFGHEDQFKFNTASRPAQVPYEEWTKAKSEANHLLVKRGVRVIIYVVLHDIARRQDVDTRTRWALNAIVAYFDLRFLAEHEDVGAVAIDRVNERFGFDHLRRMLAEGVSLPDGRTERLNRIVLYSMTAANASHLSSLCEIALGSVRYAVNFAVGRGNEEIARNVLRPVAEGKWFRQKRDGNRQVGGYGFLQYPKELRSGRYSARYRQLAESLAALGSRDQ